jgi:hypothetical protein
MKGIEIKYPSFFMATNPYIGSSFDALLEFDC